jgi:aromatic-L-amino-acid decarboxylase
MRYYGLEGLQKKIRHHIELSEWFEDQIQKSSYFELVTPRSMNLTCFRFKPTKIDNLAHLNQLNEQLMHTLNASGSLFLTHTKVNDIFTLRMVIGQTNVDKRHVERAWELIQETAKGF